MNAWLPQAGHPCGNFSDTAALKIPSVQGIAQGGVARARAGTPFWVAKRREDGQADPNADRSGSQPRSQKTPPNFSRRLCTARRRPPRSAATVRSPQRPHPALRARHRARARVASRRLPRTRGAYIPTSRSVSSIDRRVHIATRSNYGRFRCAGASSLVSEKDAAYSLSPRGGGKAHPGAKARGSQVDASTQGGVSKPPGDPSWRPEALYDPTWVQGPPHGRAVQLRACFLTAGAGSTKLLARGLHGFRRILSRRHRCSRPRPRACPAPRSEPSPPHLFAALLPSCRQTKSTRTLATGWPSRLSWA